MERQLIVDFVIQFRERVFLRHTPLSQFLRKYFPKCLIEILIRLFDGNQDPDIDFIVQQLSNDRKHLQYYLCSILVKMNRKDDVLFKTMAEKLFLSYLECLRDNQNVIDENSVDDDDTEWMTYLSIYAQLKKYRYDWLDDCTPFPLSYELDSDISDERDVDEIDLNDQQRTLIDAQSLLCFLLLHCDSQMFEAFLKQLPNDQILGVFSLRILCLIGSHQIERAVQLIVNDVKAINGLFAFALEHCKEFLHWKSVVEKLTQLLQNNIQDDKHEENARIAYDHVLWHLASITNPDQFLQLLPRNGAVKFFERFITHCYSCQCSRQCTEILFQAK